MLTEPVRRTPVTASPTSCGTSSSLPPSLVGSVQDVWWADSLLKKHIDKTLAYCYTMH
jgi:hypothetical protein